MTMSIALRIAGVLLALIAASGLFTPRILHYRENMTRVEPTVREIFYIHNLYVTLFVAAFAAPCLIAPGEMAGTSLGRYFCGFLAAAWLLRLVIQFVYHNPEIKRAWPVMNIVYTLTFLYLGVAFAAAAALGR